MSNYARQEKHTFLDKSEGMNANLIFARLKMSCVKMTSNILEYLNCSIYLPIITDLATNNLHALSILSLLLILKYNILD